MRLIGVVRESEVVWRPHSCRPSPLSFTRLVLLASSTSLFISTSPPVHSIRPAVAFVTISVGPAAGSAEVLWIKCLCDPNGNNFIQGACKTVFVRELTEGHWGSVPPTYCYYM